jgi:diguanylate cyclase (GGDEF)-like protein/PAS domain S-box-containing protein
MTSVATPDTDAESDPQAQLADEHEALMQFLYLAPVGLVQTDGAGEIAMINPISAQLLMPLSSDGTLQNLFTALEGVAPELRHLCAMFTRPSGMVCDGLRIHVGQARVGETRPGQARDAKGTRRGPQVLSLSLMKLDPLRLMAVLQDVSEQVRRERQLRQNDAWLSALMTSITDYALVGLDGEGRVADWNDTIGRVTGHSRAVVGTPYSVFYPSDATTPEHVQDRLREADQNGWSMDEGPRRRADGSEFWASAMIAPLPDRDPQHDDPADPAYCMVLRDISDKRDDVEKRRHSVFTDHLTGVGNRRAFFDAAELELARNRSKPRPTGLILIDADNFKGVNDRHGHPAGDAVLQYLGALLAASFRQVDVVARVGGEEFAVLLPSSTLDEAVAFDGVAIAFTVSAGVAATDGGDDHLSLDALMKRADRALYAAKALGRNRVQRWLPALDEQPAPPARDGARDADR